MNELATIFKPDDVTIELEGKLYRLVFDLNAFCEVEKIYDSVDVVLQKLLAGPATTDETVVYNGGQIKAEEITVGGVPLPSILASAKKPVAKHADTLNLLWIGLLHDAAKYNDFGEIIGYNISKAQVGSMVTFKNLREVNAKIVMAILRDLIPSNQEKNVETPGQQA